MAWSTPSSTQAACQHRGTILACSLLRSRRAKDSAGALIGPQPRRARVLSQACRPASAAARPLARPRPFSPPTGRPILDRRSVAVTLRPLHPLWDVRRVSVLDAAPQRRCPTAGGAGAARRRRAWGLRGRRPVGLAAADGAAHARRGARAARRPPGRAAGPLAAEALARSLDRLGRPAPQRPHRGAGGGLRRGDLAGARPAWPTSPPTSSTACW
jgi:hypothetical protein